MTRYLLSIGSNAPSALQLMERANAWLLSRFVIVRSSGVYSSKAINRHSPDYLNMVVKVDSDLSTAEMAALGKQFERECGRTPLSKSRGCVEMDVDIIQADNVILRPVEFTRQYFLTGLARISDEQS